MNFRLELWEKLWYTQARRYNTRQKQPPDVFYQKGVAKFQRTPFLQNTSGWLLLTKLHDPNRRKMGLPFFKWRWPLNDMNIPWYFVFSFLFFCLEKRHKRTTECKRLPSLLFFFFESITRKVLDHSYVQSSLSTITRHLGSGIWKTPYNWIFYGHRCQGCTKIFNSLLCVSLSLKQA